MFAVVSTCDVSIAPRLFEEYTHVTMPTLFVSLTNNGVAICQSYDWSRGGPSHLFVISTSAIWSVSESFGAQFWMEMWLTLYESEDRPPRKQILGEFWRHPTSFEFEYTIRECILSIEKDRWFASKFILRARLAANNVWFQKPGFGQFYSRLLVSISVL